MLLGMWKAASTSFQLVFQRLAKHPFEWLRITYNSVSDDSDDALNSQVVVQIYHSQLVLWSRRIKWPTEIWPEAGFLTLGFDGGVMPLGSRQRSVVRVIVMTYPATSCPPQMDYSQNFSKEPHSSPSSFPGFLFSPTSPTFSLSLSRFLSLCCQNGDSRRRRSSSSKAQSFKMTQKVSLYNLWKI